VYKHLLNCSTKPPNLDAGQGAVAKHWNVKSQKSWPQIEKISIALIFFQFAGSFGSLGSCLTGLCTDVISTTNIY
jgi:hypothetical protein